MPKLFSRRVAGITAATALVGAALLFLPQAPAFGDPVAGPAAQATATATAVQATATAVSPQPTAVSPQPTPAPRPVRFFDIDPRFGAYYERVDGFRVMGRAISPSTRTVDGFPAQYFEKARLEDRTGDPSVTRPEWQFAYGLLVDEMKASRSRAPVSAERSTVTYDTLQNESDPAKRAPVPPGYGGNVLVQADGSAFIPFSIDLSAAPGHSVPKFFWDYISRPDLFPGGWLHDVGLPITEPIDARVDKGVIIGTEVRRVTDRPITYQAFQRTILTYDAANPEGYLVERANTGTDFMSIFPDRVPQ